MTTKAILVLSTFLFCSQLYAQNNDLKKLTLHGNIKNLRESSYIPVEKDGKIQNGDLEYYFYNTFNPQGNKIDDIKYTPDGKVDKK